MAKQPEADVPRATLMALRLTPEERAAVTTQRKARGQESDSGYVRDLIRRDGEQIQREAR